MPLSKQVIYLPVKFWFFLSVKEALNIHSVCIQLQNYHPGPPLPPYHSNHTHTHTHTQALPFFKANNDTVSSISLIVNMMQEQSDLTKKVLYIRVLTVFLDLFPKGPGEQIYRHRTRQNTDCPWTKHMSMFLVPACVRHWVHLLVSVHPLHLPALKNVLNKL